MRASILGPMGRLHGAGKDTRRGSHVPALTSCCFVVHMCLACSITWADSLFGDARAYPVGTSPVGIAVGELSGTPGLDLATADEGDTVTILTNRGDGVFQPGTQVNIPERYTATAIVTGRFNADTIDDIAVAADDTQSFPDFTGSVLMYRSTAVFTYGLTPVTVGALPRCVVLGDLTGDDIADLVSCGSAADGSGLASLLQGNSDHTFAAPAGISLPGIIPSRLYIADIDHDGRPDLLVLDTDANAVWILYGSGAGPVFDAPVLLATISAPTGAVIAPFAADKQLDIAVVSRDQNATLVFRQSSRRNFGTPVPYAVGMAPVDIAGADFNHDGLLDLVSVDNGSSDVMLLQGKSDGSFQPEETVVVGDGPVAIAVADFNGDNKPDFATANQDDQTFGADTQSVSVVLNGVSPPLTPAATATPVTTVKLPTATPPVSPVVGTPTPTRTPLVVGTATQTPTPAGPGDADCNGRIDAFDVGALANRLFGAGAPGCADADVNGDGSITAGDLPQLVKLITASH
jgi:hypothetical protein